MQRQFDSSPNHFFRLTTGLVILISGGSRAERLPKHHVTHLSKVFFNPAVVVVTVARN